MSWRRRSAGFLWLICVCIPLAWADPSPSQNTTWQQWLATTKAQAVSAGISFKVINAVFNDLTPDSRVIAYSQAQPEGRLTYLQYRQSRGDEERIRMGISQYQRNAPLLNRVAHSYGVSPCAMVALWGIETNYGRFRGTFSVTRSLATLAFASSRSAYFNEQLLAALHVIDAGHIDNAHYTGEWAGASGQPQFMPSSVLQYAVDYDGDGRKNIWTSLPDVFASIANYLVQYGWQADEPWAYEVNVPAKIGLSIGENNWHSVADWQKAGLSLDNGQPIPDSQARAVLIMPNGGPGLLAFHNFYVFEGYNNSMYYAGTVSHMANAICTG